MKKANSIGWLAALTLVLAVLAGCLNEKNRIPENCYDGICNQGEERIDCGGPCMDCDPCTDGIFNPEEDEEEWLDCGGPNCEPCPPENNGVLDEGEEAIDCGDIYNLPCEELCGDGLLNGDEELIDCGGTYCDPCPTCDDQVLNGDELGVDCGSSQEDCPPCDFPETDCTNGVLDSVEGAGPTGGPLPIEWGVDCGGTNCVPCGEYINYNCAGIGAVECEQDAPGIDENRMTATTAGFLPMQSFTLNGIDFETGQQIEITFQTPDIAQGNNYSWPELFDANVDIPCGLNTPAIITVTAPPANGQTLDQIWNTNYGAPGIANATIKIEDVGSLLGVAPDGFIEISYSGTLSPAQPSSAVVEKTINNGVAWVNIQ